MKKAALAALALSLSAAALLCGLLWLQRRSLPYNEMGRYFDARYSIVYHEQAVLVYGLLTALFALPALLTLWWAVRAWRR
jgi:hypothetical protein